MNFRDYKRAISYFQKVIEINPHNVEALFNLGNIYFLREEGKSSHYLKYEKAIAYFKKVVKIDPRNVDALFNLGFIYSSYKKGFQPSSEDYEKAIEYFNEVIELDPYREKVWSYLGGIYEHYKNDIQYATEIYEKGITYNPDDYSIYHGLGQLSERRKKYKDAIEWYHRSLKKNPTEWITWHRLSFSYKKLRFYVNSAICNLGLHIDFRIGKLKNIKKFLQRLNENAIRKFSEENIEELGHYFKIPNLKKKVADLRLNSIIRILEQTWRKARIPDRKARYIEVMTYLDLIEKNNRFFDLTERFNNLFNTDPQLFEKVLRVKAEVLFEINKYEYALKSINKSIKSGEHDFYNHRLKAQILYKLKRYSEAIHHFQLGMHNGTFEDPNSIVEFYQGRARQIEPKSSFDQKLVSGIFDEKLRQIGVFFINIGICYKHLEKFENALEYLEQGKNLLEKDGKEPKKGIRQILLHDDVYWIEKATKYISASRHPQLKKFNRMTKFLKNNTNNRKKKMTLRINKWQYFYLICSVIIMNLYIFLPGDSMPQNSPLFVLELLLVIISQIVFVIISLFSFQRGSKKIFMIGYLVWIIILLVITIIFFPLNPNFDVNWFSYASIIRFMLFFIWIAVTIFTNKMEEREIQRKQNS